MQLSMFFFCRFKNNGNLGLGTSLARDLPESLVNTYDAFTYILPRDYSHKPPLSCKFRAISGLNIPRDAHLILTSSCPINQNVGWKNKWQTPKQINYVSTKLLARVHRAGAGSKSRAHTAIWPRVRADVVWGGGGGCSGTPLKFSHIFMSRATMEETNICCEKLQN